MKFEKISVNFRESGVFGLSLVLISTLSLGSCSGGQQSSDLKPSADKAAADRAAAQAKLARILEAKQKRQALAEEQQRIAEEKAAAAEAEAAKPHYDPVRLARAKKIRQWQSIIIPDLNIQCWLKSTWSDGKMNMRLAMIGDKNALTLFTGNWAYFKLVFTDQGNNNLQTSTLASSDLHWASPQTNGGNPTMEFEGSDECPLEVYESIVQWNFKWDDHI